MLAREIGGQHVEVTVLAPPNRDVHYLQAKPSMINSLRRTDLLVAVGGELEAGWLPVAISSAANGRILPGQTGYFEAAAQVSLLSSDQSADRALGDTRDAGDRTGGLGRLERRTGRRRERGALAGRHRQGGHRPLAPAFP